MARAIWKGVIRFDDIRLPVKLYSAVQDLNIHFHLLHDQDMVRVKQRMVNPRTDETVPAGDAVKGYEIERQQFVILSDDELQSLEPEPSRDIRVTRFVDPALIGHQWYVRPYYLGPDENEVDYFALAEALARQGKEGVARWVMRKKQYVGALRSEGGYLMLITLRHVEEVISAADLEPPTGRPLDKKERDLAEKLIEALRDDFDPGDYRDEYRKSVMELIEAKRRGKKIEVKTYAEKPKAKSLAESLQASLEGVK